MARLHFALDDELHRKAKSTAALRGVSLKDYVTAAIAAAVDRDDKPRRPGRKRS